MTRLWSIALFVAALASAAPTLAQLYGARVVDPRSATWVVYDPVPGLDAAPPTPNAIAVNRGNVLRWRDAERSRIGGYSRENEAINNVRQREYQQAFIEAMRRRTPVPPMVERLPVGPLLTSLAGYFWYAYDEAGTPSGAVVSGAWRDGRSSAGDPTFMYGTAVHPDRFCQRRRIDMADVTYLGPALTPEIRALDTAVPPSEQRVLNLFDARVSRRPDARIYAQHYPMRALEREKTGDVSMECTINPDTTVSCVNRHETPEGWGFGEAGLLVAQRYAFEPTLQNGEPSAGRKICINIGFYLE